MVQTLQSPGLAPGKLSWILILAVLGGSMATAEIISGSMLPLMATGLRTSEGMVGQAVTASAIMAILTSLSIGKITRDYDRRHLLIVFTLFLIISNLGVGFAPNVWVMLVARLFLGVAIGIVWGLIPAIVLRLAPPGQFARSFTSVMLGVSAASVIAAPLSASLGAAFSWRVVYMGATGLAVGAVLLLIFAFPSLPAPVHSTIGKRDLGATLALPGMLSGMLGIVLIFGGAQAFFGYLVPFLESITGLRPSAISLVLLIFGISGLFGTLMASRTLSISLYGVLVATPAVLAILLGLLLAFGHMAVPAMMILGLWSFGRAHIGVAANAWIALEFPDHVEGAGGILVAAIQGSMMIGAMLGGVLIDNVSAEAPPTAGAILLAVGAVYCFFVMKPRSPLADEVLADPLSSPELMSPETPLLAGEELA